MHRVPRQPYMHARQRQLLHALVHVLMPALGHGLSRLGLACADGHIYIFRVHCGTRGERGQN